MLVLGKSDCDACNGWSAELEHFLETDTAWRHVRFGKLLLDKSGLISFKRANPWIAELDVLPHNVVYHDGERAVEFSGAGVERLLARLSRVLPAAKSGA